MKKECRKSLYIQTQDIEKLVKVVEGLEVDVLSNGVKVYGDISINELLNKIIKAKVQIDSINSNESSLEEYYLDVIRGEHHG